MIQSAQLFGHYRNKLNRGRKAAADGLRREGENEGIVRQAGHRIIKHIHEK